MYRTLLGIVGAIVSALVVALLTFGASAGARPDFVFINGTEPKTLDPQTMTGQPEGRLADALFEGLTYRDPKSLQPRPGLATSWTVSPDGRTYRFTLRPGVTWSDGVPVTGADVAWSWRRLEDPETGSEYAYILHMIRGAEAFNTFGSAARSLREDILPALAALAAAHPDGVPAKSWVAFLGAQHVTAAVKGTTDPLLDDLLGRKSGVITPDELARARTAFEAEATARQAAFEHADAHFGVDEGVFVDPADPSVLVVELTAPTPYFLELTGFYPAYPVPRHVVERHPDDWFLAGRIVSNGPYRLTEWRVNDRIRLEKSATYWDRDAIELDIIDALPITDTTASLNLFLTQDVDWAPGPPLDLVEVLQDRPEFRTAPGMIVYYYRLNCTHPALSDPRVRQALALAVDRRSITEKLLKAGQVPAYHIVPPGLAGYEQPESALRFDVEAARRLLAEAGHPDGKGIGPLRLLFNTNEAHKQLAEVLADQLRRNLGIDIQPLNKEWQTYQADTMALDYEIARAGWIGDYLDPNTFLDMWVTNGGNNQTGWSDPRYDRLIRHAADIESALATKSDWLGELREPDRARTLVAAMEAATDPAARRVAGEALRMHLFREAEALLFQEAFPIIPIYFYVTQNLVHPWVEGWYSELELPDGTRAANLQDIHPLRGIRITGGPRAR